MDTSWDGLQKQAQEMGERQRLDFRKPRYRRRAIVLGAYCPETTLQNWINTHTFELDADKSPRVPRLYSHRDVVLLAAASRFTQVGVAVPIAGQVANWIIDRVERRFGTFTNAPPLTDVYVWRDFTGQWQVEPNSKPPIDATDTVIKFDIVKFFERVNKATYPHIILVDATADEMRAAANLGSR